jgi:hypothetical protein
MAHRIGEWIALRIEQPHGFWRVGTRQEVKPFTDDLFFVFAKMLF